MSPSDRFGWRPARPPRSSRGRRSLGQFPSSPSFPLVSRHSRLRLSSFPAATGNPGSHGSPVAAGDDGGGRAEDTSVVAWSGVTLTGTLKINFCPALPFAATRTQRRHAVTGPTAACSIRLTYSQRSPVQRLQMPLATRQPPPAHGWLQRHAFRRPCRCCHPCSAGKGPGQQTE